MNHNEINDLLNVTIKDLCPDLHIDFFMKCNQPNVFIGHINVTSPLCFDVKEIMLNNKNAKRFLKLISKRTERSLMDIRRFALQELRKLRKIK